MIIAFVDIAGFTALTEAHGDDAASETLDEFETCIRSIAAKHGLKEIKTIGDAFLLVGDEADEAVRAAQQMVTTIAERDRYPDLRIGIHAGDVVMRGKDIVGKAVNLAARVAGEAIAGQVLVTREVLDGLDSMVVKAQSAGTRRLRHVSGEIELFDVAPPTDKTSHTDPVCHMSVSETTAYALIEREGTTYYLCSRDCVEAFLKDPSEYVGGSTH